MIDTILIDGQSPLSTLTSSDSPLHVDLFRQLCTFRQDDYFIALHFNESAMHGNRNCFSPGLNHDGSNLQGCHKRNMSW
ncbi:hypothetical protein D3C77_765960 [compost metagenome]